jgi:hypothetical protein
MPGYLPIVDRMPSKPLLPRPALSQRQYLIVNGVLFQLAWLGCVLGGSLLAVPVTALVIVNHLRFVADSRGEVIFLIQVLIIGFLCDMALVNAGVLATGQLLPPLWLTCLWLLFGSTVGYALQLFHGRLLLCIAGGAVFAPLSYYGGARLAAVPLLEPIWLSLLIIGLIWAVVFPGLVNLYTVTHLKFRS